jgi:hypothetical protein
VLDILDTVSKTKGVRMHIFWSVRSLYNLQLENDVLMMVWVAG